MTDLENLHEPSTDTTGEDEWAEFMAPDVALLDTDADGSADTVLMDTDYDGDVEDSYDDFEEDAGS